MSIKCPSCGLWNAKGAQVCDCGHRFVTAGEGSGGLPVVGPSNSPIQPTDSKKRPLAGIAVAGLVGGMGLLWSWSIMNGSMLGPLGQLMFTFPGLQLVDLMSSIIGVIINAVVLIGAFLAFNLDPRGPRIVRIASWAMLASITLVTTFTVSIISDSAVWSSLEASAKGSIIGGVIGGAVGGGLIWVLILFLFRKRPARG